MGSAPANLEIACRACGAVLAIGAHERTVRCPWCDSPAVVDRPATVDRPDPRFAIGFAVDKDRAAAGVRAFIRRRWLAPRELGQKAADRVRGLYLPAYLYSATATTSWRATIAEVYEEVGLRTRRGGGTSLGGKRRIEHRELEGAHTVHLSDVVVTASRGVGNDELEAIEPFDLDALARDVPAAVSGWPSEEPSLARDESLEMARAEARARIRAALGDFMPGDGHSGLAARTELSREAIDLVLLPVWVFAFRRDAARPPIRVLVNGQTGAVAGRIPISWGRVAALLGALLGLLAAAALVARLLGLIS